MAKSVNRTVNIYINSGEAQKAYDRLIDKQKQLKKELESATDPKIVNRLKKELKSLEEPIDRAGKKLRGELQPSFKDLHTTVNELGKRLKQMSQQDADYSKVLAQYRLANNELKRMKGEMDKVAKAQKEQNDSTKGSFWGTFMANMLDRLINVLQDLGREAVKSFLELGGVERAFKRINTPGLLDNLRKATKGTVTDLELMKRAVTADNFGIPVQKLGTLLQFAQLRARETGESVDFLVNSIVTGIARKSPMILDNLGINIGRVNEQFSKTGDFAQAAFNIVDEELQKSGEQVVEYADKWDQFKTTMSNTATTVVSGLVSMGENVWDFFDAVFSFGNEYAESQRQAKLEQKKIVKENQLAREQELVILKAYQVQYAKADKAGRDKIVEQMRDEIKRLQTMEAWAYFESKDQLAHTLGIKLQLWERYFREIGRNVKGGDTIANLQKEIQMITEIRDNAVIGTAQYNDAVKKLKVLQDRLDALLNRKKPKENLADDFRRQLAEMEADAEVFNELQFIKDIRASEKKYNALSQKLREAYDKDQLTLKQYSELYTMTIDAREKDRLAIIEKWNEEARKKQEKEDEKETKRLNKIYEKQMELFEKHLLNIAKLAADHSKKEMERMKYRAEVDLLLAKGKGKQELQAKLDLLKIERQEAIRTAKETNKAVEDINREYDQKEKTTKLEFWKERIGGILGVISELASGINNFNKLQSDRDQAQLDADRRANDRKKDNFQKQLDNKQISQAEYDKKVQELERQQEKREKAMRRRQFRRDQIAAISEAGIATALAVTKALPDVFKVIWTSAMGLAQIGFIASQKAPEYAKGGILNGPAHNQGGLDVINRRTGRKEAEVEGGEAILSTKTVANNRELVDQLLYNSMFKGGARLKPKDFVMPNYNFGQIARSLQTVRRYETGGILPPAATGTNDEGNEVMVALTGAVMELNSQLASGITARTYLSDHEQAVARKQRIKVDVTMK